MLKTHNLHFDLFGKRTMSADFLTDLSFSFDIAKTTIKETNIIGLITNAWTNETGKMKPMPDMPKIDSRLMARMPL